MNPRIVRHTPVPFVAGVTDCVALSSRSAGAADRVGEEAAAVLRDTVSGGRAPGPLHSCDRFTLVRGRRDMASSETIYFWRPGGRGAAHRRSRGQTARYLSEKESILRTVLGSAIVEWFYVYKLLFEFVLCIHVLLTHFVHSCK